MDRQRLDQHLRWLSSGASRRRVLAGLASGLAAVLPLLLSPHAGEAKNKKNKRRKHRKNKKKTPTPSSPPPPPGPVTRADAACPGGTGSASSANGNARYAQTFTAMASGPLVSAQLRIGKAEDTIGDYILRLSAVTVGGVPTNTVLASALLPDGTVPDGISTVSFTFPNPFSVVAGVQYALVITRPGSSVLQVNGHDNDTCAGGAFFSNDQNDAFAVSGTQADLIFATFVSS